MALQPLTTPLTPTEREDFRRRFEKRLEKVKAKTANVFAFKPVDQPPFIVNSALYHVFGLDPDTLPDAYFDDPAVMTHFQERNHYDQIKRESPTGREASCSAAQQRHARAQRSSLLHGC